MKSIWSKFFNDPKEKQDFEQYLRNSGNLTDKLKQILHERLETLETESLAKDDYDQASWPFHQADINGEKRGLRFVLALFDL